MLQRIRRQHHPNFRKPWRNLVAQAGDLRFANQYDGRRREPISAAASAGNPAAEGSITASGFAGRCFLARSVATAAGLPASQAR